MRTYIHFHLIVNLAISQITFVAGIDKTGTSESVPIHCQVVAVFLHYFFLVSFMWMLMEGVFLYITLIVVFEFHTKRYLALFTVLSYGLPALYMGLLTLPLGFRYFEHAQYGYQEA